MTLIEFNGEGREGRMTEKMEYSKSSKLEMQDGPMKELGKASAIPDLSIIDALLVVKREHSSP